jgi:adenosylcobinamide-GDP ribazoletransferase
VSTSDRPRASGEADSPARANRLGSPRLAVAFLTVVPVRLRGPLPGPGVAAAWFPVVGGILGGVAGGVDYLARPAFGPNVSAVLAAGVLVGLTGSLHLDGLADCADGLGARGDRTRRLEIMRDSAIGTFGALALILWLALFVSALAGLDRAGAARALVVAAALGRWAALVHARSAPPARFDGLGAAFTVPDRAVVVGLALAGAVAEGAVGPVDGLAALAVATGVGALASVWSRRAVGGRTGDTLGASVAVAEVAVVVALLGLGVG